MTVPAITDRYLATLDRLALRTTAVLLSTWDRLGSWSMEDGDRFHDQAHALVTGAALAAVSTSAGYVSALGEEPAEASALIAPDAAARLYDPFEVIGHGLANQVPWADAVASGRTSVEALGSDTVNRSARQALVEQYPHKIGWVRSISPGDTCNWCMSLSGAVFMSEESATFGHTHCHCRALPVASGVLDRNAKMRADLGWDEQAAEKWTQRDARKRLQKSIDTAKTRQEEARVEQLTERDEARRERLSIREQEWETRAERAAERLARLAA